MIERQIFIINKLGLHARAAAKLVTLASSFQSTIELKTKCKTANGKSIMSVMMLAAGQGTEITLLIEGHDEKQAVAALEVLINQRFDESE
ncbi:MAG: HPr family phosphocarrier protein [gamma proteobacterium symbiont of Bathyaustriella thionipta]|nr:HPr family phosphocarrier protein [gamma proteobacterium symbiont of Bathyaustriella thionipta]MCU7948442.1 HPr family phosphocarrier protein [gamma proteobacterium symbiont of Bathyaustriella thionipta]MCU7954141.1 HPr family phosphocarrier protein [gamma proteobacterium symbiont of Bathyaustriella thionipta]MCU7955992.1 HPr family phosphocarrier protein [gamma proteobacterium symbiont of Bathyaustriella thionipta]MCU7968163.1 HPr family phosphocarrier protein [gamma proteobacterium symbion